MSIFDLVTAQNQADFHNAVERDTKFYQTIFPAKKQLGLRLQQLKGANGKNVALAQSAFDVQSSIRARVGAEVTDKNMPFFKESMLVKEEDRQQFNLIADTGRKELVDAISAKVFNDNEVLIESAHKRLEQMAYSALATGKVQLNDTQTIDYGLEDDQKYKATASWDDPSATPLDDIQAAIDKADERGSVVEVMYINPATLSKARKATSVVEAINGANGAKSVPKGAFKTFIENEFGIGVIELAGTIKDGDKTVRVFPDGVFTLAPAGQLGSTVFGTTPEESDLFGGGTDAQVQVVDTGIAVTTTKKTDPVNVETKVSMVAAQEGSRFDEIIIANVGTKEL